ncbi:MAG: hypothetical protein ACLP3C_29675 [Mycobacterium sp.]|uniref:hypothetical protein n=1 Tax=Mycobacterium sp. TaxID=1785 RepID=UPI003F9D022A
MPTKKDSFGGDMVQIDVTEDRVTVLKRLQRRLQQEIDLTGDQRSLVLLTTRLQSVMAEIDELEPYSLPSAADQIAARRRARRSHPA